jgi:peptidoglycan/LPS O-acetylase OafA/YrhL
MKNKPELDGVRGLAILMVLFWHYLWSGTGASSGWLGFCLAPFKLTWSGVDLFFVLSGYLIAYQLWGAAIPTGRFYRKRMLRIFPLYFAIILAYFVLSKTYLAAPGAIPGLFQRPIPLGYYLVFAQNYAMAATNDWGASFLAVTWSVALEVQFYLIIPWVVRVVPVGKIPLFCLGGILLSIGCTEFNPEIQGLFKNWQHPGLQFYLLFPWRSQAILAGIFLAWLDLTGKFSRIPSGVFRLLFLGSALLLFYQARNINSFSFNYIYTALCFGCLVAWLLADASTWTSAFFRMGWLRYLGKISYGIYLFQIPVRYLVEYATGFHNQLLLAIFSSLVVLLLSHISYQYFERRFSARKTGLNRKTKTL